MEGIRLDTEYRRTGMVPVIVSGNRINTCIHRYFINMGESVLGFVHHHHLLALSDSQTISDGPSW